MEEHQINRKEDHQTNRVTRWTDKTNKMNKEDEVEFDLEYKPVDELLDELEELYWLNESDERD